MPPLRPELFTPSPAAHNAEYSQLSSLTSPLLCLYSLISKMIQNEASHTCVNNAQMSNFILEVSSKIHISISNYPLKIFTKEFLSSTSNLLFLVGGHSSLLLNTSSIVSNYLSTSGADSILENTQHLTTPFSLQLNSQRPSPSHSPVSIFSLFLYGRSLLHSS